jgi:chromosome segregation ATPase
MDVESSKVFANELEIRLPELKAGTGVSAEDAERTRALTKSIEADKKELAQLESKSQKIRDRVSQLEDEIENVGGQALKKQRELVAALQASVASAEADVAKKVAQIKNCDRQAAKLEKDAKKAESDAAKLQAQLDDTLAQFKALEGEAFKVMERMNATQAQLTEKEAEVDELKKEFDSKQGEVSIIRQVEVDIAAELEQQRAALAEETAKLQHWTKEQTAMRARLDELTGRQQMDVSISTGTPWLDSEDEADAMSCLQPRPTPTRSSTGSPFSKRRWIVWTSVQTRLSPGTRRTENAYKSWQSWTRRPPAETRSGRCTTSSGKGALTSS